MHQLDTIFTLIWQRKFPFLLVFFVVVTLSYGVLYALDFYPETPEQERILGPVTASTTAVETASSSNETMQTEDPSPAIESIAAAADTTNAAVEPTEPAVADEAAVPLEIEFDVLDKTIAVKNPTSRAVADLDAALLEGVVRHPDSATFADPGNIFILGHSSYLPNVINKNFQAFNGIQKLEWGDTIRLRSADTEYRYRVDRVYEARASEVVVPNSRGKAKLTLATCDSFGSKDDRFIVEATLIESTELAQS